jgi:hypothetical protein
MKAGAAPPGIKAQTDQEHVRSLRQEGYQVEVSTAYPVQREGDLTRCAAARIDPLGRRCDPMAAMARPVILALTSQTSPLTIVPTNDNGALPRCHEREGGYPDG